MIRGKTRAIKKDMKLNIHNRFDLEVIDSQTGKVKQKAYAENIVLEALWQRLLAPNTYFNNIHYGTGTGSLVPSRTSLFSLLGAKTAGGKTITYKWDEGWISSRKNIQLLETEHVGSELTEVGIGYGSSSGNLVTHALLKDMNGNTITILKTDTDIINIYATVFVHWKPEGYDAGGIKLFLCENNYLLTGYLVGDYNSAQHTPYLGYYKGSPQADYNIASPVGKGMLLYKGGKFTYSVENRTMSMDTIRLGAAEGNPSEKTGIKSLALIQYCSSNQYYKGPIPVLSFSIPSGTYTKSVITGEAIGTGDGVTTQYSTRFPYVISSNIYVDGVENKDVTVTKKPLINTTMGIYFELVYAKFTGFYSGNNWFPSFDAGYSYSSSIKVGDYGVWYNPNYQLGIKSLMYSNAVIDVSDDLINWDNICNSTLLNKLLSVPAEHHNKKFWRVQGISNSVFRCNDLTSENDLYNITFASAPESGSAITADYECEVIAKDSDHVFDFSFEITLGEKTG